MMPVAVMADQLGYGQRVKKFIGNAKQRPVRCGQQGIDIVMPGGVSLAKLVGLQLAQMLTGFQQMHRAFCHLWHQLCPDMPHITHQRAASGAELDHGCLRR